MSQAKTTDITSRRRFLAGAAVAVLAGTPALAAAEPIDPIFATIEAHKAARAEFVRCSEAEPASSWDPGWAEYEDGLDRSMAAEHAAAIDLLNVQPTTLAGLLALLRHAVDYDTEGLGFPEAIHSSDERDIERSWQFYLIENAAAALADRVAA
ncbi:twin-arginine translocation signal domain-containing protein [Bradyrhizobium pachyrhizi]|uniref:Twin-arginine translocation signal domain-containing protein n=1 Tax=Bradyrhizobium pachyrhizi TaxID=280333 RepID=A0A844ST57_9BRAD|nr:twin-arginine translocation signal domain-containing protein [Bradyrhizobium pachyrhizi]MVT69437.1 twin-arginine translocation signal domain-containing protein [Bradyrhizobium pachyrhizi]